MKKTLLFIFIFGCLFSNKTIAQESTLLKENIHKFLQKELSKTSGEKTIKLMDINMEKFPLIGCKNFNFSVPKGTRLIGRTTVSINCSEESLKNKRNVFIPVEISIKDKFYVANKKINAGQIIKEEDLAEVFDNVGFFPEQLIIDKEQIVGKKLTQQILEGQPFKNNMINLPIIIQYNQEVQIIHGNKNYQVSARGKSMGLAKLGQEVKIKMPNGKILLGIAQSNGSVIIKEQSEE